MRARPTFWLTKTTKENPPQGGRLYSRFKNKILGKNYQLSLTFIGEKLSHYLNKTYRGKNQATDILSFPLAKNEGEIFINLKRARIESRKFSRPFSNFVLFLLIHGLCHLKGMTHGVKMEAEEKKFRKIFGV